MDWITSDGGPLICLGHSTIRVWQGTNGLSEHNEGSHSNRNDYERACHVRDYLGLIPVGDGVGIVLGEMPLDTTVWPNANGLPTIARVFYSEPFEDIRKLISTRIARETTALTESVNFSARDQLWHIFDSAYPGTIGINRCITFNVPLGNLFINTYECKPDAMTSLLLHQFSNSCDWNGILELT